MSVTETFEILIFLYFQPDPVDSSEDSAAYRTEDDFDISNMGPSQSQIVMATEQITKKIQELLQAAQGGRNSKCVYFLPTCANVC